MVIDLSATHAMRLPQAAAITLAQKTTDMQTACILGYNWSRRALSTVSCLARGRRNSSAACNLGSVLLSVLTTHNGVLCADPDMSMKNGALNIPTGEVVLDALWILSFGTEEVFRLWERFVFRRRQHP